MAAGRERVIQPAGSIRGRLRVPGDKSISHRALMLGAIATGVTRIHGVAPGDDCRATRACLEALGVSISDAGDPGELAVEGRGLRGLAAPAAPLDARNSGTTARLLMGLLCAHPFRATIVGDASLSRRPMRRVVEPLSAMGGRLDAADGRLPVSIEGGVLHAVTWAPPVPSAQVKTAVLFAGLHAEGVTTVVESAPTRDHTERALRLFGAPASVAGGRISVTGGRPLQAADIVVPGDPSSAAFFAAAAAALPGSRVELAGVGLNPTRTAFLDVLRRFGAQVQVHVDDSGAAEPSGTLIVAHGESLPIVIRPDEVPGLIDELPVLAALGALGAGFSVHGAGELRVKESDRIRSLAEGLRALGAEVDERPDGITVAGGVRLSGARVDAAGDHRLAMAFTVAALGAGSPSVVAGADVVSVSYPGFFEQLEGLCQ